MLTRFLVKRTVKNSENVKDGKVREKYGLLVGYVGIVCNFLIFLLKFSVGIFINSIASISDSFNNLADCASSVVAAASAKLSNKRPDEKHPFGYGRIEYLATLLISFLIIFVGLEFCVEAFKKIIYPEKLYPSLFSSLILAFSLIIKFWNYRFNKHIGKTVNSPTVLAIAKENGNDVISTFSVLISSILSELYPRLDGISGLFVSVYLIYSGICIAKENSESLLGSKTDPELVRKITEEVNLKEEIIAISSLCVHEYGPNKAYVTLCIQAKKEQNIYKTAAELKETLEKELCVSAVIQVDVLK